MRPLEMLRATPEDAPALTAVAVAAKRHWGYPETWINAWMTALTFTPEFVRDHATFKAMDRGEILGVAAIEISGAEASIVHLWVLPKSMGCGVGSALFAACEAEARSVGVNRLIMESDPNAEGFYRKMGGTVVGKVAANVPGVRASASDAPAPRFLPVLEKRLT